MKMRANVGMHNYCNILERRWQEEDAVSTVMSVYSPVNNPWILHVLQILATQNKNANNFKVQFPFPAVQDWLGCIMPEYVGMSVTTVLPGQNQWAEIIDKI